MSSRAPSFERGTHRRLSTYAPALVSALATVLALELRLREIGWGSPYVYHPDEHSVVHAALSMVREGSANPKFFHYPSLLLYVEAGLVAALQPWIQADLRTDPALRGLGPWDVAPEHFPFVLAGRVFVAVAGAGSVLLVAYLWGRWLGSVAAMAAAWLLAVSPLHVENSHYLTTDVPAMLWVILALFWSASAHKGTGGLVASAVCAGLAASTKYPAGIVFLAPLAAALGSQRPVRAILLAIVACVGAFALTSPFVVLEPQRVWADLAVVRHNYSSAAWSPANFWYYPRYLSLTGLGPVASALVLVGWWVFWRQDGTEPRAWRWMVAGLPWFYLAYLGTWSVRFERNLMPLLPFALLFLGIGADHMVKWAAPHWRPLVAAGLVLLIAWLPLRTSQGFLRQLALPDTRTLARQWIEQSLQPGSHVAREEYTPQVDGRRYRVTYVQVLGTRPYSWYLSEGVDYLVASSSIYERYRSWPGIGDTYRTIFDRLPLLAEFRPGATANGPTIRIYEIPRWREPEEARGE
ncbi:MAG: hypothetical protein KatS3mg077_1139 [Candidatus Binatia bacterium]|nr:MAG: hypothetical protein KatS3mg077_1139 [Candidatus Binatia bacterium]